MTGESAMLATLGDMWERNLRLYADRLAVVCGDRRLTYRDVVTRARRLASAFHRGGVAQRDRVAMLAMNCAEWIDFYACCELHGFHALTINFRLAAPEIAYILDDAAPRVLIFEAQYTDIIDSLRPVLASVRRFICIGGPVPGWAADLEAVIAAGDPAGPDLRAAALDPAHLIYTSGTTGRPKGVVRTQAAGLALAASCAVSMAMKVNGRGLILMPLFHVGAQSMASGQHWNGGTVIIHRRFDAAAVARALIDEHIHMTHMAPAMIRQFMEDPFTGSQAYPALETFCYASAPMPVPLLRRCIDLFGPVLFDCYGSTETGNVAVLQSHLHILDGSEADTARLASVGQEHQFSRLRVCDDDGRDCAPGVTGELYVRADAMMSGYWNNSTATVEAFDDGWYRSGDLATIDPDGFVFLVDRKKDMIISGGENIYCREVEDALATHPAVAEVAIIGVPDERWGEAVKAVVVVKAGQPAPSSDEIIAHSRSLIAGYKRPQSVDFVEDLPRVSTGKVNKVALRNLYRARKDEVPA